MSQNELEMANAKAIQANAVAIQKAAGKIGTVLSDFTLDLNDDVSTRFQTLASALERLGLNVIPKQDTGD